MIYRIIERGGKFYPQSKDWFGGWEHYFDGPRSNDAYVYWNKIEYARSFLDQIVSGVRDKNGVLIEEDQRLTIHNYP